MKVIKRDGRIVDYDKSKIKVAIEKANTEVTKKEKATKEDIKTIIEYIEELNKKRILVEDIQDIIEQKLMELGKYELAKKYIVYRYTRALIRKSNTTDASILGLIRNANKSENKNEIMASAQRNLIVGEVSKDLTKRILLPEKIIKAWEQGVLYFHGAEYFIQPIINSCYINMQELLDSKKPQSYVDAALYFTQIIINCAKNQYGEVYVDIGCLAKYTRKNEESAARIVQSQLNELMDISRVKFLITATEETVDLCKQLSKTNLQYIYILNQDNCLKGGKYDDITRIFLENNIKEFMSEKYKFQKFFNQGVVTINLPQIAISSDGDEEKFWQILDQRLELCREALMYRYYALMGTTSDVSPIHWKYGVIAKLEHGEKIDTFLDSEYSNIYLGYIGIYEMTKLMKGVSHAEPDGKAFAIKVIDYIKNKLCKWKKASNIGFKLYGLISPEVGKEFAHIDKEIFGTIEGVTNKKMYTNSYHFDKCEELTELEKLKIESELQKASNGDAVTCIDFSKADNIDEIINFTYENSQHILNIN